MAAPCPSCSAENPATARFCEDCGSALALTCPSCGAAVTAGKRFCGSCGTPLTGVVDAPPAAPAPTPVAERRLCSILFCDLVGFTPLSESRDPEEVRELLSRYFETARTVIARYGGVVEKFIGDAVMAVWGTPVAVEGDTERAVRAALDLVSAIAALGQDINASTLAARAGVVTGEVAVTVGAVNEGMVAGDAVNTAARVQSVAAPGTVFVDAATRRLAQAGVEFTDGGEFELKGKSEPQQLFRAGRVLSNVGGAQRVDGLEAPMTGRDPELRLIKELFHASVDRRQLRLVAVTGAAGVGKSRLGWEFEKYVDGLAEAMWWHRGRCLSYGEGVSFWALAEIVRQRLEIAEEDSSDVAAAKLAEGIERYLTDPDERDYVGVRLARLLGVTFPNDPGQELAREELFAGWRLWFERLADTSPVVLLIEDLHNADAGLLDFLDHLLDWGRDAPIFVLTFGRPEMRVERPTWGTGRNRTQLTLDPLDDASMATLLDALVPGLPPDAATAINAQARGIPLFTVETIRALIDRDIVIPSGGVYQLVGEIGTLAVPDSLHALLAARLDALAPEVRSLVADAAVLGTSFPPEAVSAVSGRDIEDVRDVLTDLVRRAVLEIVADPLSPQRGTYRFGNDMLRQVARDTLSRHDRKARHLAVAAHLRATFANDGEEVVDVIAKHYLDALAAVPDAADADETRLNAVDALVRAGERATRVGARGSAGDNFADAAELVITTSAPDATARAADLWLRAAESLHRDSEFPRASELADRAQQAYVELGDTRGAARAEARSAAALRSVGRHTEARVRVDNALAVLREDPDANTVDAVNQLAVLDALTGDLAQADRVSAEAITIAQGIETPPVLLTAVFHNRALILYGQGRRLESVMYLRQAVLLAEQAGDVYAQSFSLSNIATQICASDPDAAVEAGREAAALARRAGGRLALGLAIDALGSALLEAGDWDGAAATLSDAIEKDGIGDQEIVANFAAHFFAIRGDVDAARAMLPRLGYMLTSEDPQDRGSVAFVETLLALAEERNDDVVANAKQMFPAISSLGLDSEFVRTGWPIAARAAHDLNDDAELSHLIEQLDGFTGGPLPLALQAERALALARRAARQDDPSAGDQFAAAIAVQRKSSPPHEMAWGLVDYANYLIATGRTEEAEPLLDEARQIGERLGAEPLVKRAAKTLASSAAHTPA